MAIQRVQCPQCNAAMNVAANMGSVQCSNCGNVFSASQTGPAHQTAPAQQAAGNNSGQNSKQSYDGELGISGEDITKTQKILAASGAVGFLVLMFVFFTFLNSTKSINETSGNPPEGIDTGSGPVDNTPALMDESAEDLPYRVVDISEEQRLRLYRDYLRMENSGFGKAKRIPKSGKAGQDLNKMLVGIADREIELMALSNNLTNDDVRQIIAEGKIKGWE